MSKQEQVHWLQQRERFKEGIMEEWNEMDSAVGHQARIFH